MRPLVGILALVLMLLVCQEVAIGLLRGLGGAHALFGDHRMAAAAGLGFVVLYASRLTLWFLGPGLVAYGVCDVLLQVIFRRSSRP